MTWQDGLFAPFSGLQLVGLGSFRCANVNSQSMSVQAMANTAWDVGLMISRQATVLNSFGLRRFIATFRGVAYRLPIAQKAVVSHSTPKTVG